jgi:hypothetical protein
VEAETLIFQHIPKTGVTALSCLILQHFDRRQVFHVRNPEHTQAPVFGESFGTLEDLAALPEVERAKFRCILGQMAFGVHKYIPREAAYVGVFRDPVERILCQYSQYTRAIQKGEIGGRKLVSLEKYLKEEPNTLDNNQSRFLLATDYHGSHDEARFGRIKAIFNEHFLVVGILERFEEMVVILNREMGWPCIPYQRRNVGRFRTRQAEISSEILNLMREKNRLDFRVHDYAEKLLNQAIFEYGSKFQADLANLRSVNEVFERSQRQVPSLMLRSVRHLKRILEFFKVRRGTNRTRH